MEANIQHHAENLFTLKQPILMAKNKTPAHPSREIPHPRVWHFPLENSSLALQLSLSLAGAPGSDADSLDWKGHSEGSFPFSSWEKRSSFVTHYP